MALTEKMKKKKGNTKRKIGHNNRWTKQPPAILAGGSNRLQQDVSIIFREIQAT